MANQNEPENKKMEMPKATLEVKPKDSEPSRPKEAGSAKDGKASEAAKPRADEPIGWIGTQLAMGEIAILLDTYDDIFSDFDPRPYEQRELSDDFLKELSRRHLENKKGGFEVRFLIPSAAREPKHEAVIKKRLKEHFIYELHELETLLQQRRGGGMRNLVIGLAVLGVETVVALQLADSLMLRLASLLLVPAGWFFVWTGMERMLDEPYSTTTQRAFYEKFTKCNYLFVAADPQGHRPGSSRHNRQQIL